MGRLENLPDNIGAPNSMTAEHILRSVTQDLRQLQQELVTQLDQDVKRLKVEKSRLISDIEMLQRQRQQLQDEQHVALSQQQLLQQQVWAKQLAYVLANHLQAALVQRMNQATSAHAKHDPGLPMASTTNSNGHGGDTDQVLSSLDTTLNRTFTALRQDLNSYQSSLSQQIQRMHSMEQQGEAILEVLVNRLSHYLRMETMKAQSGAYPLPDHNAAAGAANTTQGRSDSMPLRKGPPTLLPVAPATAPEPAVGPVRSPLRYGASQFKVGFVLILLSTIALSLHNVAVNVIANPSSILGLFQLGGFIKLNSVGNSLWILLMRMWVVVPSMAIIACFLYDSTWRDIKKFALSKDRALFRNVIGSGLFLFLSQVLIYIAIGQIGPGIAVTILFMYPIVTVPLAWAVFGDRPTRLRMIVMFAISMGVILTALPKLIQTTNFSFLGIGAAAISGISFAFYLISMQISFRKLHPVPVSLIQFVTIFILTHIMLLFFQIGEAPANGLGLFLGGIVLGLLTLAGYLLNNFGVRFMGAARASIIASSGPVLTALLAYVLTPGTRTTLQFAQWVGILVVTASVIALSFEKMISQNKAAKLQAKPK